MTRISTLRLSTALALGLVVAPQAAWGQSVVPTVAYPGTVMGTPILEQERGLSLPVPPVINVAAVNAQEAASLAASRNAGFTPNARCGFVAPWAVSGNRVVFAPGNGFGALGLSSCYSSGITSSTTSSFINTAFAERRVESILVSNLIDNSIGNPGTVTVRGLGFGLPVLTVSTADLAAARQLLASMARAQSQRRYFVGNEVRTGGGPTIASDRVLGQSLTGRDTLIFLVDQIGDTPARQQNIVGTQINCPSSTSTIGCTGGVFVDSASDSTTLNVHTITTLYITSSVERTITGGTTFFDAALTPLPAGAVHPAAQTVSFDQSSLFLARMLRGAGFAPVGGSGKVSMFLEGVAAGSNYRADGAIAASRASAEGLRGGIALAASPALTLGLAGEGTRGRWTLHDATLPESTHGDAWRVGGFAAWQGGPWRAHAAGFGGRQQVSSTASSTFGGGTSIARYDADVYGAGVQLGLAIPAGNSTLTPSVGVDWLGWQSPTLVETGGLAPLSVAATSRDQLRSHIGLAADYQGERIGVGGFARGVLISGDRQGLITASDGLSQAGSFAITGPSTGHREAELGGHLSYAITRRATIGLSGAARFGGDTSYGGQIGLRVAL